MHQTVASSRATQDPHAAASAPLDIALQEGRPSSLQHAFERLEGGVDPSDHLGSSDKVKMDPSTITELQIPSVWWCYCGWRIRGKESGLSSLRPLLSVSLSAAPAGDPCRQPRARVDH